MNETRFAIIGCGRIARRHAQEAVKNGQLVAVCDTVKQKADALAAEFSSTAYYSIEELLASDTNPTIVAICTPNGLHAEHSIRCLKAGKHVLCEKPMAITSGDALEMVKVARETQCKLYVVKQNRFNPPVVFLKELLEKNKLGRIFNFQLNCFWNRPPEYFRQDSWRGTTNLDGGTLFTQFSHFIDLLYWLVGDLKVAQGFRSNFMHRDSIQFEDTGVAILKMNNGALGTVHYTINSHCRNMEGSLSLFGDKGTVRIGGQYLNELDHFSVEGEQRPELAKGYSANEYGYYQGSMSNHDQVYQMLLKAIEDPSFSFIPMEETLKTIEIIEKIYIASPLLR